MGALGRCAWALAALAAACAALAAAFAGAPARALDALPIPLGLAVYMALGGEMPPFHSAEGVANQTLFRQWARPGDVMVAACAKCGNTWLMNVVHQLRACRNATLAERFEDILDVAPWPIMRVRPGGRFEELQALWETRREWWDHPDYPFRVFKMQSLPTDAPVQSSFPTMRAMNFSADLRYIVAVRNPEDQMESFMHFASAIRREHRERFGMPALPASLVAGSMAGGGKDAGTYLAGWLPKLREPNVLLLHFDDVKRDPERWARRIADFLELDVPDELWPTVLRRISFAWMKENAHRFRLALPGLEPTTSGLVREGKTGAKATLASAEQLASLTASVREQVSPEVFDFVYHGGDERRSALFASLSGPAASTG